MYDRTRHAAAWTDEYVFNQLIPYIGNKRRLLGLIGRALERTGLDYARTTFVDYFAGSGVVSRFAKQRRFAVVSNDWEPYTKAINTCYVARNQAPPFARLGGYESAIQSLNKLPPRVDWVTRHLCPRDDDRYDIKVDRMFYMRKNGMRIDAIRHQIMEWREAGAIDEDEEACLLAPLLYQACYTSNTSGVFKGFHNGWGGQTGTALYRIASDLMLAPAVFHDNSRRNLVFCMNAQRLAEEACFESSTIAYLDPPYNQHPYGSNYHVLNSITLWDKPKLPATISPRTKSAIRTDWRRERRSAYNHRDQATGAYRRLLGTIRADFILTSYSTDGTIPLREMLRINLERGHVEIEFEAYKRYRVSSQRFSNKPMNVEFVVILNPRRKPNTSVNELCACIRNTESRILAAHPETAPQRQQMLFE